MTVQILTIQKIPICPRLFQIYKDLRIIRINLNLGLTKKSNKGEVSKIAGIKPISALIKAGKLMKLKFHSS